MYTPCRCVYSIVNTKDAARGLGQDRLRMTSRDRSREYRGHVHDNDQVSKN